MMISSKIGLDVGEELHKVTFSFCSVTGFETRDGQEVLIIRWGTHMKMRADPISSFTQQDIIVKTIFQD